MNTLFHAEKLQRKEWLPEMTVDVDERARIGLISTIMVVFFRLPLLAVSTFDHEQIKISHPA